MHRDAVKRTAGARRRRGLARLQTRARCRGRTAKSGKVTYRIVGMPGRDFPKVPDHREASYTTLESAVLRGMVERTLALAVLVSVLVAGLVARAARLCAGL